MTRRKPPAPTWEQRVGLSPHAVLAYERPDKKHVVYLRWWVKGDNTHCQSLKFAVRRPDGTIDDALAAKAYARAAEKYEILSGLKLEAGRPTPKRLLTIGETWAVLSDAKTGRYPTHSKYRKLIEKALTDAARILGPGTAWAHFTRDHLRTLTRTKAGEVIARGGVGFHDAEDTGSAILTVIRGLQEEGKVPGGVDVPYGHAWHKELRRYVEEMTGAAIPEPQRPRHTLAEIVALFGACWTVDPRLGLIFALGAELRAGQVERAMRSALDVDAGTFVTPQRGKKQAPTLELTEGQQAAVRRALTGYLRDVEATGEDYYLFPQGRLVVADGEPRATVARHLHASPVDASTCVDWFHAAETLAGITPVKGRGFYGARRGLTDAFADLDASTDVLQQAFGWADRRMADSVYRDRSRLKARGDSAVMRAKIRGEK